MYKRRGRVGDKLTTLFLYYWKMGNLFLGHFLLTGKEIPKNLQFLKFGESWISIICNALCDALKYQSFATKENRTLHVFWLIQYEKTYGWDLSWTNLRWPILISKSHGQNWCQFKRSWTKLIHCIKIRGQIYNLSLYLSKLGVKLGVLEFIDNLYLFSW